MDFEEYDFFGIKRDGRPPRPKASRPHARKTTLENLDARFANVRPDCAQGGPFWIDDFWAVTESSYYREGAIAFAKNHGLTCFEIEPIRSRWLFARTPRQAADLLATKLHVVTL